MPTATDSPEVDQPMGMRWSVGRILAVVTMLAIAGFWAAIFAGLPKRANPDFLEDRAFARQTESLCAAMVADLADLPNGAFIEDAGERADVLDQATDRIEEMVDAIAGAAPTTGDDAISVKGWLGDWRTYLNNRRDYAERLRVDPEARLLLDQSLGGDSVDKPIEIFAQVNDLPSCATPGDAG
ncbi:MAG: hypothetical protein KDB09_09960 [Acidimicrobiales bacterium]|nr:hypothetical protein [Acidimicrobiales bacterium]